MTITDNRKIFWAFLIFLWLPCILVFIIRDEWFWLALPFGFLLFYQGWQMLGALYTLLWISLPWSTETEIGAGISTDLPDEPLMLLVSGILVCTIFFQQKLFERVWRHPIVWLVVLHFAWTVFTAVYSSQALVSGKFALAKSWYIAAFFFLPIILFSRSQQLSLTVKAWAFSLLLVTLVIVYRHAEEAFLFSTINEAVSPFFRNHVNYSAMLVCSLPAWWAMYRLSPPYYKKWLLLVMAVLLFALVLAFSRGAWVAMITGLAAYCLVRKKFFYQGFILVSLLSLLAFGWLQHEKKYLQYAHDYKTTIFHTDFKDHLTATYKLKDVSTAERFYRWIAGVRMAADHPFVGVGPGTFNLNYRPYGIPLFKTWVSDNKEQSTVHNYFLLLLTEQGIPGLLFFLLLLTAAVFWIQHLYHRVEQPFLKESILATGSMMTMIITLNFFSDLIETDKIGPLFFALLAWLVVVSLNLGKKIT